MFEKAKTLRTATPAAGKPAASKKPVDHVAGWEAVAALDAVSKAITSLVELRKQELKDGHLTDLLVERGLRTHAKPDSLHPVEGDGAGSAYLTKRSTASPLSPDEIEMIDSVTGCVAEFVETVEKQPSLLTINPDYLPGGELYNEVKMRRIEKLLEKEVPDFIVRTEGESKTVVSDNALNRMFQFDANAALTLLPLLANIAIRPVYTAGLEQAWAVIRPLIPEAEAALKTAPKTGKPVGPVAAKRVLAAQLKASLKKEQANGGH
jgi:hypothetical protein